jgi:hypothetical protein
LLIGFWIFDGPRGIPPFPTPVAYAVAGLTIAALVCLGRRWPLLGYLCLCFFAGLIGLPRPRRGRRW